MKLRQFVAAAVTGLALVGAGLCGSAAHAQQAQKPDPIAALQKQAEDAGQRAAAETLEPNEINSIRDRRKVMGQAGLQMYVVLLSRSGQPIDYFVTDGKCISSQKRLTAGHKLIDPGANALVVKAPSEDGTYGTSEPYIYCFTVDGKYKQWNGRYYASTSPIELTIKPLVVNIGDAIQSQH